MPKKSLKDQIKGQIESLTATLTESRASLVLWESTVRQEEAELRKLQGALASLDGTPTPNIVQPIHISPGVSMIKKAAPGMHTETVEGISYEVPDGFEIGKNSFGEVSIIPKGQSLPAMEEPLKPGPVASSLPPVSGSEGFDRPEDLL